MRKPTLLVLILVCGATIAANVPTQVVVTDGDRPVADVAVVIDATENMAQGLGLLDSNQGDMVLVRMALPATACDDSIDCSTAIETACEATAPGEDNTAVIVNFNGKTGNCSGRCSNGRNVKVICVAGGRR